MIASKSLKVIMVSSNNIVISKLIIICNVSSRINGILFEPNDNLVKRKTNLMGLSAVADLQQKKCKKSRQDWLISTWRNACLITVTNAIFPHQKNKRI